MPPDPLASLRDSECLRALRSTGLLDDLRPDEALDRIVRLAARLLRVPAAALSLGDGDARLLRSAVGLPLGPRKSEMAACVEAPVVVEGQVLGALCAMDVRPRSWTEEEVEVLAELAALLGGELEHRRVEEERGAAVAARDRFYANMSHELRTPISAVVLYNDLLLSGVYGPLTPAQEEGVQRAQRSAGHLLELVNEMLDLSKLEAGKMEARAQEVPLSELLAGVLAAVRPLADEYGCVLRLEEENAPDVLVTDPRRLRQILLNLLSNAVKFGRARPVLLRCRGLPEGGVVVEVADAGPGIAEAELSRIFEEFVQLGNGDGDGGGTGLGLPISRGLAELLGGSLEAESTPGAGSTFRLRLPARAPPS